MLYLLIWHLAEENLAEVKPMACRLLIIGYNKQ